MINFLNKDINPLGMGCWPIGGAMFSGDQSLGYTGSDDTQSIRTIHAALDLGITLFDTAAAYGAGHSERLLAQALKGRADAIVATKIGIGIDEKTKQLSFDPPQVSDIMPAIEGCLKRLEREQIDLLLLHVNDMAIEDAEPIFDEMDQAVKQGKIASYGWSTDYSDRTKAMANRNSFVAVEHAMNLFFDVPKIQSTVHNHNLTALIRSPLAMGVLTGKYEGEQSMPSDDIRSSQEAWMDYFKNGKANPAFLAKLDAVRQLLTVDGRSLVQGALGWLWAKNGSNIPVPGARTVDQITGIGKALEFGALPQTVMDEIETLIERDPNAPERPL